MRKCRFHVVLRDVTLSCTTWLTLAVAVRPGIIYLLSFFYLRHEIGFRCGLFASAAPLASTFAGALAYGITSGHSSFRSWRLLFLVEGLPTIILAPVAFYFIPDSPAKARFLGLEEKAIVRSRTLRQTGTSERIGGLNPKELALTLFDAKAWCNAVRNFWLVPNTLSLLLDCE